MLAREKLEELIPEVGGEFDVIVCGGGPAGIGAALAAADQGAKTLLLESQSYFGGVAAVTFWMPINRLLLNGGNRGGVIDSFVAAVKKFGPDASIPGKEDFICGDGLDVHPDYMKLAILEVLEEAGVHYRLYSPVTEVILDGDTLAGVVTSCRFEKQSFFADAIVDATGDGDVAYKAGAEMVIGREEDGLHMPVSLVFALTNLDEEAFLNYFENSQEQFEEQIREAGQEGYCIADWYDFDRTTIPNTLSVNNGAAVNIGNINAIKARDLTIAERMGLRVAVDFVKIAREKKFPGLENCCLMSTGPQVGVRDTRRLVGEYVLTVEDARTGPEFPDAIARRYGNIDACQIFIGEMKSGYGYPYRCMLPKKVENLLVAGRCGSATFMGHAAGKSMGNIMEIGQAAGVAAAMSSAQNIAPRNLEVEDIQQILISMGVSLD